MVQKRTHGKLISVTVIVLLSAMMQGCLLLSETYVIEEPFTEIQVNNIRHGETTKQDILRWFGPPLVVARPGAAISVAIPAEGLFEQFKASSARPSMPLLYYYKSTIIIRRKAGIKESILPIPPIAGRAETVRELWILIDEKIGVVVDHRMEKKVDENCSKRPRKCR